MPLPAALACVQDGVLVQAADGRIAYANPAAAHLLGLDSPETLCDLKASTVAGMLEVEVPERGFAPLEQLPGQTVLAGLAPDPVEARVRTLHEAVPDRWLQVSAEPVTDPDGRITFAIDVLHDVTPVRRAEDRAAQALASVSSLLLERQATAEASRRVEGRLRTLLDQAPDAMVLVDAEGRIVLTSAATERLFGWAADEMIGKPVEMLMPERLRAVQESHRARFQHHPVAVQLAGTQLIGLRKDGEEFPVDISLSPIRERGRLYALAAVRDATARAEAAERDRDVIRTQAAAVQAEATRERSHFLADATAALAASLDEKATLQGLVDLIVPRLADWCVACLTERDEVVQTAVAHVDPAQQPRLQDLMRRRPILAPLPVGGAQDALRPTLFPTVPETTLDALARDRHHASQLRELGLHSAMVVPLLTGGRSLGSVTLVSIRPERTYDHVDLDLAMELASRCAKAVEHALLYRQAQTELAERRRVEAALQAEKERLAVTLRSIADGVVAADTDGRIILVNRVAEELTGWPVAEAIGRRAGEVLNIVHDTTGLPLPDPVVQVAAPFARETGGHARLLARDGTARHVDYRGAPMLDQDGRSCGVVVVLRDITDRNRLEDDLLRASKLESLGVLAGGIAHDFNNILTGILANLSLAEELVEPDHPVAPCVADAAKAAERARNLTAQLLTFAKGGAPVRRPLRLGPLLQEAARFVLAGSSSRVVFQLAEDLWPVNADPGQLAQVIQNLVLNAAQAMPDGGTVTVRAENATMPADGGEPPTRQVRIQVADTGVGIAPQSLSRIFDPYFTTKSRGSGLGLATAYAIVRKHDGQIAVESDPGVGTTFTIHLPATAAEPAPVPTRRPADRRTGRILVMDDDPMMRTAARTVLQAGGHDVHEACDGAEAIEAYRMAMRQGQPFDAVVLDLTVPGAMGGREALARLRSLDPDVLAVVSSGYSDDPIMAAWREHGFAGVVAKPYTARDLDDAIQAVLARRDPA